MTCRFLENLTLSSLVAPVAEEEFRRGYWEQKPLIVHREDPDYYAGLFTLQDFDEAITRSPHYVKMANAATQKNKSYKIDMAPGLEAVAADMREGGTLVLDQLHHHEPKLGQLCRLLGTEFGHKLQTNLYLTPPHGKGFSPHWDNHDVFILQVLGSKHWNIEKERRTFPEKSIKMGDEGRELRGELTSFTLKQGDLIYIPRGFVHAAECGDEPSLHITLGVTATFFEDFLHAAIKAAIRRDERLRVALPLGFMRVSNDGAVKRALATFQELADETFLNSVMEQFRDELVRTFPLDVSGQVEAFFHPTPLALGDLVGPRRGIIYRKHDNNESTQVNFGGRTIVFPNLFRDALDFALNTPIFAIRDIAGELEDEERIVFVERLMQEGMLVRKQPRES
jgi:ribosomal protein L16 Arg81 hydroxylase